MSFHWEDPEWKAEWLRKKAAARARKAAFAAEAEKGLAGDAVIFGKEVPLEGFGVYDKTIVHRPGCEGGEGCGCPATGTEFETTLEVVPNQRLICPRCGAPAIGATPMEARCSRCDPLLSDFIPPIWNEEWNRHGISSVDAFAAINLLRRFFTATRLRSAGGGWQPGKCAACPGPHPHGVCVKKCPCHEVERYLLDLDTADVKARMDAQRERIRVEEEAG